MALAYNEFSGLQSEMGALIKQYVLRSSDWAHLQLTTGTQATTLASQANAGATSISTVATIPANQFVVIGNGSANPEVRRVTSVSGAGPYTVSFATALASTYTGGAAVGVGSIAKATTTRGAQMVVDFNEATPDVNNMYLAVYQAHDGTTGTGKLLRYIYIPFSLTTNIGYYRVSAGKEHLWFDIANPRWGETGYDPSYGPGRTFGAMCDVVPYHAGDAVPCVAAIMHSRASNSSSGERAMISRNQGNTASWVPATLLTLNVATPMNGTYINSNYQNNEQRVAKGDGKTYLWPFVVVEDQDGLRGRLASFHNGGYSGYGSNNVDGYQPTVGLAPNSDVSYGGTTYRLLRPVMGSSYSYGHAAFSSGQAYRNSDECLLIAVPVA
jgi:hypothetical protein